MMKTYNFNFSFFKLMGCLNFVKTLIWNKTFSAILTMFFAIGLPKAGLPTEVTWMIVFYVGW